MSAKVVVADLHTAIERIQRFRSLFERLFEVETRLETTVSEWDRQQQLDEVRSLRREMTRLAEDVHADLSKRGSDTATLYLRDAPAMGGRVHPVPLVQALIDGSARAYNVTPDTVDVQFEAALAWYEKQLTAASERVHPPAKAPLGNKARVGITPQAHGRSEHVEQTPQLLGLLHTSASLVGLITGTAIIVGWIVTGIAGFAPWWPF